MPKSPMILLYHAISDPELDFGHDGRLDTMTQDALYRQLEQASKRRRFVCIDELTAARDRRGLAAVTFDDGHRSVLDTALPVLEALNIPFTIFINGHISTGGINWRDKIRLLIDQGLEKRWRCFTCDAFNIPGKSFYFATKDPSCNSREVDRALDAFLGDRIIVPQTCLQMHELVDHPLVSWGNHGHHHYVLSSLDLEAQIEEVLATEKILDTKPNLRRSRLFSIPFGARRHFNGDLIPSLRELGFSGALTTHPQPCTSRPRGGNFESFGRLIPGIGAARRRQRVSKTPLSLNHARS